MVNTTRDQFAIWYVDDISVTGAQWLNWGPESEVMSEGASVHFTPADAGDYAVQVTPLFNGPYPETTPRSAAKLLTVNSPVVAPAFFNGSADVGGGFSYLPGFGYFKLLPDNPGYVFHNDLGFLYCLDANDGKGAFTSTISPRRRGRRAWASATRPPACSPTCIASG